MRFEGVAHCYGRDVDTDAIIAAHYLNSSDPDFLASHCMEDLDSEFTRKVKQGDILVAQENFGCGSSREHAPIALKHAGIDCVIAVSFARIFYRNAINTGLAIMECPKAAFAIHDGDHVAVDAETGTICDIDTGESFSAKAFPPFIAEIIKAGGLVERTMLRRSPDGC